MGKVTRKRYSGEFRSRVALEAIRGEQTLAKLASKHGAHLFWQDRSGGDSPPGRRGEAACEDWPIAGGT